MFVDLNKTVQFHSNTTDPKKQSGHIQVRPNPAIQKNRHANIKAAKPGFHPNVAQILTTFPEN